MYFAYKISLLSSLAWKQTYACIQTPTNTHKHSHTHIYHKAWSPLLQCVVPKQISKIILCVRKNWLYTLHVSWKNTHCGLNLVHVLGNLCSKNWATEVLMNILLVSSSSAAKIRFRVISLFRQGSWWGWCIKDLDQMHRSK